MFEKLSQNTYAALLLCGHLTEKSSREETSPLTVKEYATLAVWLMREKLKPSDLLSPSSSSILEKLSNINLDPKRIKDLLSRTLQLTLALERWNRAGINVISRSDVCYPSIIKQTLKQSSPPILYIAGNMDLLNQKERIAVVGSRNACEEDLEFAKTIGCRAAEDSGVIVSGGAKGVDLAAMEATLEAGGSAIGVLSDSLMKAVLKKNFREAIQGGKILLLSPFSPESRFLVGKAMARNKYIYILSTKAVVVASTLGSGGTWTGAEENLKKGWTPLFVKSPSAELGNAELIKRGGILLPADLNTKEGIVTQLNSLLSSRSQLDSEPEELNLFDDSEVLNSFSVKLPQPLEENHQNWQTKKTGKGTLFVDGLDTNPNQVPVSNLSSMDMYSDFSTKVKKILSVQSNMLESDFMQYLGIEKKQAKVWFNRAIQEGWLQKSGRPLSYSLT